MVHPCPPSVEQRPLHDQRLHCLQTLLRTHDRLAVAFSGGADSSLLLKVAVGTLGPERVLALFAQSELLKTREIARVLNWARHNGYGATLQLEVVVIEPLQWPLFIENGEERCYLCKRAIYEQFLKRAESQGFFTLADGTNFDDLQVHRPGRRAILELGVITPLADAGLRKADIRALGQEMGLSNWDHPSASCLATRITSGVTITASRLRWVEEAEEALARLGIKDCRVQLVDGACDMVVVHINAAEFAKLLQDERRTAIVERLKGLGAGRVLLNLEGR